MTGQFWSVISFQSKRLGVFSRQFVAAMAPRFGQAGAPAQEPECANFPWWNAHTSS
jgi:hypothetical protein